VQKHQRTTARRQQRPQENTNNVDVGTDREAVGAGHLHLPFVLSFGNLESISSDGLESLLNVDRLLGAGGRRHASNRREQGMSMTIFSRRWRTPARAYTQPNTKSQIHFQESNTHPSTHLPHSLGIQSALCTIYTPSHAVRFATDTAQTCTRNHTHTHTHTQYMHHTQLHN
jgi:hypothetical protein